jgi:EF hand
MKLTTIAAALVSVTALGASVSAQADESAKHFRAPVVVGGHARPVYVASPVRYVAPAPGFRHFTPAAPVVVNRYAPNYYAPRYAHNGYWSNGRWIAPVILGAAVLGSIAVANNYYVPPAATYVNPAPTYYSAPVVVNAPAYAQPACDTFCQADRDQNGVIDKVEASFDRTWEKWFYDIDRNNDGVITRQELNDWNRSRAIVRPY